MAVIDQGRDRTAGYSGSSDCKMSKVKLKKCWTSKGNKNNTKNNTKRNKRSSFNKNKDKKQKAKTPFLEPPSDTQEYSSNWKTLLQAEKKEGSKQMKNTKRPSSSKDSHKPDKHFKKGTQSIKTASLEKDGKMQSEKKQRQHKHFKAEKRKIKDGEDRAEEDNKKKKPDEENTTAEPDLWFDDVDPDDIESTLGKEIADIMRKRLGMMRNDPKNTEKALVKEHAFEGVTRAVAMDCEMVGVGHDGEDSILARVSIVNHFGKCIYDKYVKPTEEVTDYRTHVSGIRPADIADGEDLKTVQKEVAQILEGRILVGHAIHNDLKILLLAHPKKKIRDTQKYKPFRKRVKSARPALRNLCKEILNVQVQQGEHSSVQDAQATMRLYTMVKKEWEAELKARRAEPFQKNPRKPRTSKNQDKTSGDT